MDKPYEEALREYAKVVGISLEQAKYEHALAIQQGLAPPRRDTRRRGRYVNMQNDDLRYKIANIISASSYGEDESSMPDTAWAVAEEIIRELHACGALASEQVCVICEEPNEPTA